MISAISPRISDSTSAPNPRARCILFLRQPAAIALAVCALSAGSPSAAREQQMPQTYPQVRLAMGRGDYAEAHRLTVRLLQEKDVYPPLYETTAYIYVYQRRFVAGHAFFDSLLAAGHHQGNVAGGHAILWLTQQRPDSTVKYARLAVLENSQCVYPYEIFVEKSFECKSNQAALELLQRWRPQRPENWRLAYAIASWYSLHSQHKVAVDTLRALLASNIRHWRIYFSLGQGLWLTASWQEAKRAYDEGLAYCDQVNDEEGKVRLLYGRAQAEQALGQWQAAVATLQQGLDLTRRIGNRLREGWLLSLLGEIQLKQQQWLQARQTFEAVVQCARNYALGDLLLHAYYYLSQLADNIGKRSEALQYTYMAYHVADSLGMKTYAGSLIQRVALIELSAGREAQALELLQEALQYALAHGLDWQLPYLHQNLACNLDLLGKHPEALLHCEAAQRLAGKRNNAEQLLNLKLLRAKILFPLKRTREARALLAEAAESARHAGLMAAFTEAQILFAQREMGAGQYRQAKQRLAGTLAALPETPAYETNLRMLALFAEIAWRTGERPQALKVYEDALKIILAQMPGFGSEHLSSLSRVEREVFFSLSRAYAEMGQIARALVETERARDLIVKRKRWHAQQLAHASRDSTIIRKLASLDAMLQEARLQRAATNSTSLQLDWAAKIAEGERQQQAVQGAVKPWLETLPFDLSHFRRSLNSRQEIALSFFVGDSSTLVFFLAPDTLQFAAIAIGRRSLEQGLLRIHAGMSTGHAEPLARGKMQLNTAAAHDLYRLLLQDFLEQRPETALAIVPDGALHALPFEILTLSSGQGRAPFLVERFAVRYGSTLTDLQQDGQDYLPVKSFLLAAAPAAPPAETNGLIAQRDADRRAGTVGHLEAEIIRSMVQCKTDLAGANLTRDSLLLAMQQSDWLHIASHCTWRPAEPLFGEIDLVTPPGRSEPQRLFAFEIFQMALPVQMAVLSGCETVRGTFVDSEGFEGFVQAFRAAGAPSVIASLWKVDDFPTSEFFRAYYKALRAGQSTMRALQTAKLEMLANPNYDFTHWAAFAYYGRDWRVQLPAPWGIKEALVLAGMIVVLFLAGWQVAVRLRKHEIKFHNK